LQACHSVSLGEVEITLLIIQQRVMLSVSVNLADIFARTSFQVMLIQVRFKKLISTCITLNRPILMVNFKRKLLLLCLMSSFMKLSTTIR
jgi:hypothetical protein